MDNDIWYTRIGEKILLVGNFGPVQTDFGFFILQVLDNREDKISKGYVIQRDPAKRDEVPEFFVLIPKDEQNPELPNDPAFRYWSDYLRNR